MQAGYIIKTLLESVPEYTDLFSDSLDVSSVTRSNNTVTVVTAKKHNLKTAYYATITGAVTPVPIASITRSDGVVTVRCAASHDLTEGFFDTVSITGAIPDEYNGTFPLLSVPNRKELTYKIDATPTTPATGNDILLLTGGIGSYNGRFKVTYVDDYTFTYELSDTPYSPPEGDIKVKTGIRISGAATIERAIEAYTKQPDKNLWAFVVLEDTSVNKDRTIRTDAVTTRAATDEFRTRLIKNFGIYVFAPSIEGIAARTERDMMEDVEVILYKSVLGLKLPSPYTENTWSLVTPTGNGIHEYNRAYYIHRFGFQFTYDLLYGDTAFNPKSVAFRNLDIDYYDLNTPSNNEIIAKSTINLDEKP